MGRKARLKRAAQRALEATVRGLMLTFIGELRAILKRRSPAYYAQFPNAARPCHTCAFNPSTDNWQGMDATADTLMRAIRDDHPFYCHENIPWTKPLNEWTSTEIAHYMAHRKLCAGYAVIVGDPGTKRAFMRATLKTNGLDAAVASVPGAIDLFDAGSRAIEKEGRS